MVILPESGFRIFCFVAKILAGRRGTTSQKRRAWHYEFVDRLRYSLKLIQKIQ